MLRFPDLRRADLLLLGVTVVLTLFGLAMIASVSVFESHQLTERLTGTPYNSFYLWRSFWHLLVGFGAMLVGMMIPYRLWERHARSIYFLVVLAQVLVFVPGIGASWGTSNSWIHIGGFSVQPSEYMKIALIFYLAVWLQKREQAIGTFREGFVPFVTLLLVSTILVAIEPDLGSFLVLSCIACIMFFVAGGNIFHLLLGGGIGAVLGLPIILQQEYVRRRFVAWVVGLLNPNDFGIREGIGFQIYQALVAIGSGGLFGVGYGKSIQKFGYLPQVQDDMIFSAMAEELGFFRLLIVLLMYSILIIRGFRIAQHAPDRFSSLVATGITTWIAVQTLINISVNTGLFPITGLTLPFISYGGTSLSALLGAVGILLNISMHSTEEAALARRTKKQNAFVLKNFFS